MEIRHIALNLELSNGVPQSDNQDRPVTIREGRQIESTMSLLMSFKETEKRKHDKEMKLAIDERTGDTRYTMITGENV